ncbi:MAG: ATP-binding protein [Candidatus Omnitrophota bacterium]
MKFRSVRFKISILYTIVLGVILVIYSAVLYFNLKWVLYDDLDEELRLKAKAVSETITSYLDSLGYNEPAFLFAVNRVINKTGEYPEQSKITEAEEQWLKKADKLDIENDYVDFLSPEGRLMATMGDSRKETPPLFLKKIDQKYCRENFINLRFDSRNLRMINLPFMYDGKNYAIRIAASLKPVIELLRTRLVFIAVTIPVMLIFSIFVGRFFAARILNPVKKIAATAQNISHEDLSRRVEPGHFDEEMESLVNAFNKMIDRLENSFKHISDFSSHVSHELKTPLAIIRGESELALRKERSPEEYKRVIHANLDEVSRMFKLVEDLLVLSKLEYRPEGFKFEEFAMDELIGEIYEQSRLLASSKNISVNLDMSEDMMIVKGDRTHLRRLFFNLIHNAVKFTMPGGKIDISVSRGNKKSYVSVKDTGTGISKEDMPKIFDKFFHVEKSYLDVEPGTGLGLNIALVIAKIHNGEISVKSEQGQGSIFTVTLPLV